jgi:hypothetical protein
MPEDSGKEPTEKEQQERFEDCLDTTPIRTKKLSIREPRSLVRFIMQYAPGYVWLSGNKIKKKFPDLRMSVKKINEMQNTTEYYERWRDEVPDINKMKSHAMYDLLQYKYFEKQMQLPRGPDYKAVQHFGVSAGKIDPMGKLTFYDGDKLSEEKQKELNEQVVNALLNKIKREQGEKEGGDGNGK